MIVERKERTLEEGPKDEETKEEEATQREPAKEDGGEDEGKTKREERDSSLEDRQKEIEGGTLFEREDRCGAWRRGST